MSEIQGQAPKPTRSVTTVEKQVQAPSRQVVRSVAPVTAESIVSDAMTSNLTRDLKAAAEDIPDLPVEYLKRAKRKMVPAVAGTLGDTEYGKVGAAIELMDEVIKASKTRYQALEREGELIQREEQISAIRAKTGGQTVVGKTKH